MSKKYKLIVNVPLTHADAVRQAMGDAGAGVIGNYTHCSFSVRGTGRFKGNENANPHIGRAGQYQSVEEERIEASFIPADKLRAVVAAMEAAHPYEETAYEIVELVDLAGL